MATVTIQPLCLCHGKSFSGVHRGAVFMKVDDKVGVVMGSGSAGNYQEFYKRVRYAGECTQYLALVKKKGSGEHKQLPKEWPDGLDYPIVESYNDSRKITFTDCRNAKVSSHEGLFMQLPGQFVEMLTNKLHRLNDSYHRGLQVYLTMKSLHHQAILTVSPTTAQATVMIRLQSSTPSQTPLPPMYSDGTVTSNRSPPKSSTQPVDSSDHSHNMNRPLSTSSTDATEERRNTAQFMRGTALANMTDPKLAIGSKHAPRATGAKGKAASSTDVHSSGLKSISFTA